MESDDLASAPHPRNYNAARCGLGRLGRVLGDVASSPRDLGRVERNDRDLATPSNLSAGRLELAFTRSGAHNPFEHRRRALAGRVGSGVAWAVDADDDVEVDNSAPLELRSLHEPNTRDVAEPVARYTELAGEPASDGLRCPLPERGRQVVPGGLLVVPVGLRVDRAPESVVVERMTLSARASAVSIADRVDAPERWCGQGHHHGRVCGHGLGHALATAGPAGDELERVGTVGLRAGWTLRGAAIAARHEEHTSWLTGADDAGHELTGLGIDSFAPSAQADRVSAAIDAPNLSSGVDTGHATASSDFCTDGWISWRPWR
jgi:hypothetical protein